MPSLTDIPWLQVAAALAAAAFLAVALKHLVLAVPSMRKRDGSAWDRPLLAACITLGCALAPVFFLDMFRTVTDLLSKSGFPDSWTVPAATEGAFVFLYVLGLWLQRKGKPKAWLRWAPYPFAAASLFLNVYAAHGNIPAMVGHASVTVAFFLPVLAAEAAVHCTSVTDGQMRLAREMADAMTYARDLTRDQKGPLWRLRVPSLLRKQITRARPPAVVLVAVRHGAENDEPGVWEKPVEDWVTAGLTRRERMTANVATERARVRAVHAAKMAELNRPAEGEVHGEGSRVTKRRGGGVNRKRGSQVTRRSGSRVTTESMDDMDTQAEALRILADEPDISGGALGLRLGKSKSYGCRLKNKLTESVAGPGATG